MTKAIENSPVATAGRGPVSEATDEELLLRYRKSEDRAAFEVLVHRYERELYSYLRRYLGDANLAEDAFQATFLQVHLKRDQFDPERKVRPWLYTIATNQAIDAQRRGKRHRGVSLDRNSPDRQDDVGSLIELLVSKEPKPESRLEQSQEQQWIHSAVDQLPEFLRQPLNLVYYQGLKYREAADVLGVPVGTVKSRLHTAIFKLNEAWKQAQLPNNSPK